MLDPHPQLLSTDWLLASSDAHGPLAAGMLLALRVGQTGAIKLRDAVWRQAQARKVPCAWLDIGPASTHDWRLEHLRELPRGAWPVMGQAHDWVSAWSWAEVWHRNLPNSWVVMDADVQGDFNPQWRERMSSAMPISAPEGLSAARERRLRSVLRRQAGRVLALTH